MSTEFGFSPAMFGDYYYLCFAECDSVRVGSIARCLHDSHNIRMWYDRSGSTGGNWISTAEERIKHSTGILLFVTNGMLGTDPSRTLIEIDVAVRLGKKVIPVFLDPRPNHLPSALSGLSWIISSVNCVDVSATSGSVAQAAMLAPELNAASEQTQTDYSMTQDLTGTATAAAGFNMPADFGHTAAHSGTYPITELRSARRKNTPLIVICVLLVVIALLLVYLLLNPPASNDAVPPVVAPTSSTTSDDDEKSDNTAAPAVEKYVPGSYYSPNVRYSSGNTFLYGEFEQDTNSANGWEPIEWRVLSVEDGRILAIAEYGLVCSEYHFERTSVTWASSDIRAWLNSSFYQSAFSSTEQKLIPPATLVNHDNREYESDGGSSTTDFVFLLSADEAELYFSSNSDRICYPTDSSVEGGADVHRNNGACWWWLRTPGANRGKNTVDVDQNGKIIQVGCYVDNHDACVRPAIYLTNNAG